MTAKPVRSETKQEARPLDWPLLGRWLLALLLFGVMGVGAAWGVMQLRDPAVLPLKVVRIDGQFRYLKRTQLEGAVGRVALGNFFTVDVARIRAAAESLPWVAEASVRRVWPDTLIMSVTEQQPLARWGETRLVNHQGEIFAPETSELPQGLPLFSGPDEDALRVVERYDRIRQLMQPLNLRIDELAVDGRGSWRMLLGQQDLALYLGKSDVDGRIQRFLRIYPELYRDDDRRPRRVDLRYTNGLAVRWERIEAEKPGVAPAGGHTGAGDKGQV